jgi:SAM-dependent methyltransferase
VSRRVGSSGYLRQEVDTGVAELVADPDRAAAWTLLVDGTPQSYVDLDDPERLPFGYVRQLGHLIDLAAPAGTPLRVLHLGAGALSLARYVAATRPGSAQVAVDADGALVGLVRERLPLDRRGQRGPGRIRVRVADARAVAEGAAGQDWDVIVADLFTAGRTPAHLTSAEFTAAVAGALAPGGVFAANVGDGPPLAHPGRVPARERDRGRPGAERPPVRQPGHRRLRAVFAGGGIGGPGGGQPVPGPPDPRRGAGPIRGGRPGHQRRDSGSVPGARLRSAVSG